MLDIETTIPKIFIVLSVIHPGTIDTSNSESYITKPTVSKQQDFSSSYRDDVSTSRYLSVNQFDKAEGELSSYLGLTEGWDGYDGIVPSKETISSSLKFLKIINNYNLPAPKPMLSGEGEVSLYWNINDTYIEAGFEDGNLLSFLVNSPDEVFGEDDFQLKEKLPNNLFMALMVATDKIKLTS